MRPLLVLAALALPAASPAAARTLSAPDHATLAASVDALLAAGPAGTRYGLMVTTLDGEVLLAVRADERFIPASNAKMFVTAAAYAELPQLDRSAHGTGVRLEPARRRRSTVVLYGHGDARLSSAADCTVDCLATLADAVAARTRRVEDVVGDDGWFPDERWSAGMSWNNIQTRYGTGISALTLDDNEVAMTVTPAAEGAVPTVALPYYPVENRAVTVPGATRDLTVFRAPNGRVVQLTGTIGVAAPPARIVLGIDDPAHYAAWRMRTLLAARGIEVKGVIAVRHRPLLPADDHAGTSATPPPAPQDLLAELPPLPLAEDVRIIQKQSQNLHAELLLRRIGREGGGGSVADGEAVVGAAMAQAGLPAGSWTLSDGSGMSNYDRITPRAAVTLLGWIARQPWGEAWRATLPVGGRDGTLKARFRGTALDGRLFAKTGSLNASRALSGYLVAKSGRTLIFSALANDIPPDRDDDASAAVDRALLAIAAAR